MAQLPSSSTIVSIKEEIENAENITNLNSPSIQEPHKPLATINCIKKELSDGSEPCDCDDCRGVAFIKGDPYEDDTDKGTIDYVPKYYDKGKEYPIQKEMPAQPIQSFTEAEIIQPIALNTSSSLIIQTIVKHNIP